MQNSIELNERFSQLKSSGEWFWSERFINPHINPLLNELSESYNLILDTIKKSNPLTLIDNLLDLEVNDSILIKHIMILLDTSAETIDRAAMYIYEKELTQLTLEDKIIKFNKLGPDYSKNLSNRKIRRADKDLQKDILNILLYASQSKEFGKYETFKKCNLAEIVGDDKKLQDHLSFLALRSSAQIKQLRAVDLGNQHENYVKETIRHLIEKYGTSDNRYNGQQFDLVLENGNKHAIVEIAFQETTNSTIERKAKQAKNGLFNSVDENNDRLIYIIDGAGVYKRKRALKDLITNSHLICNLSDAEMDKFRTYLEDYLE